MYGISYNTNDAWSDEQDFALRSAPELTPEQLAAELIRSRRAGRRDALCGAIEVARLKLRDAETRHACRRDRGSRLDWDERQRDFDEVWTKFRHLEAIGDI